MVAITITELSREDLPDNVGSGTGKRRTRVYLRATTTAEGETLDISSTFPNVADIEGIEYETLAGAAGGTAGTWATTTYTSNLNGVIEVCLMCTLT